jgi:hypothetical protein
MAQKTVNDRSSSLLGGVDDAFMRQLRRTRTRSWEGGKERLGFEPCGRENSRMRSLPTLSGDGFSSPTE